MSTLPFVYVLSGRMRKSMFPVSWLIQARLADVATIVDENINGVRVVKSFVAEPRELRSLAQAAARTDSPNSDSEIIVPGHGHSPCEVCPVMIFKGFFGCAGCGGQGTSSPRR